MGSQSAKAPKTAAYENGISIVLVCDTVGCPVSDISHKHFCSQLVSLKAMEEKVAISLISVAAGWLLAQGTVLFKEWLAARKLRAGLLTELEDIKDQLKRVLIIHGRQLQIFALKGFEPTAALPIPNMFFKQYFKEAFSHLNRSQRISYQLIHASLEALNKKNEDLAKFAEQFYKDIKIAPDDKKILGAIELWGEMVIALYKTAMDVQWHIEYHLTHADAPVFDIMGPMHKSYVKFEHDLDLEVKSIIEKAKLLKKEDFERIYDENGFSCRGISE